MDKFEYNCDLLRTTRESKKITAHSIAVDICLADLLKTTRESKKITAHSIAADLCLSERQIKSLEENSLQYFPSQSIKYVALKKYIAALGLKNEDVIFNFNEVDPTLSLLKKK